MCFLLCVWSSPQFLCSQTGKNSNGNGEQKASDATGVKSTTATFVDSNTSVLLQTAQVLVSNPENPQHKINARLIFDTGSQRSYVSECLREELACPTVKTETLVIRTFGATTGELKSHDMVKVCIQGFNSERNIDVHAYAVNTVCVCQLKIRLFNLQQKIIPSKGLANGRFLCEQ